MSSWRPIASAPKDGTAFLAYRPGSRGYVARQDVCIVHWSGWGGGVWETQSGLGKLSDHEVTHWMPLPECPSQETAADECMAKVRQHFDERRAVETRVSEGCSCMLDQRTGDLIGGPCASCLSANR